MSKGKFNEIPIEELTTPKEGYVCKLNRFWLIGPNGGALSYDCQRRYRPRPDRHPQCNTNELIVKHWVTPGGSHGAVGYKLIPVAYWPQDQE